MQFLDVQHRENIRLPCLKYQQMMIDKVQTGVKNIDVITIKLLSY